MLNALATVTDLIPGVGAWQEELEGLEKARRDAPTAVEQAKLAFLSRTVLEQQLDCFNSGLVTSRDVSRFAEALRQWLADVASEVQHLQSVIQPVLGSLSAEDKETLEAELTSRFAEVRANAAQHAARAVAAAQRRYDLLAQQSD
jgi:hypothetical protein